jgi:hypothetical protein
MHDEDVSQTPPRFNREKPMCKRFSYFVFSTRYRLIACQSFKLFPHDVAQR